MPLPPMQAILTVRFLYACVGHIERLFRLCYQFIDLSLGYHQGWRDDHSVSHRPHHQATGNGMLPALSAYPKLGSKR